MSEISKLIADEKKNVGIRVVRLSTLEKALAVDVAELRRRAGDGEENNTLDPDGCCALMDAANYLEGEPNA